MNDEQAIRALIAEWLAATSDRDLNRLLPLMAEDVVFLSAGQPPLMGRSAFAKSFEAGKQTHRLSGQVTVEEVIISGDVAYSRSFLTVRVIPTTGHGGTTLEGHSLSIFRRTATGWVMVRDANLLQVKEITTHSRR